MAELENEISSNKAMSDKDDKERTNILEDFSDVEIFNEEIDIPIEEIPCERNSYEGTPDEELLNDRISNEDIPSEEIPYEEILNEEIHKLAM